MKIEITVSKNELLSKLKAVSKVINPSEKVNPAHKNFLFEIENQFEVTGADRSGNITAIIECEFAVIGEKLSFCVDSKTMLDGLRELPEQPLILSFNLDNLSTTIIHQSGRYKIRTYESESFSVAKNSGENIKEITIKSVDFLKGIKSVNEFASNDELRPVMCGIYIQSKSNQLSFCASDSATMAMMDFAPENFESNDFEMVFASKLARIIIDLIGKETEIELKIGEKNVSVSFGSFNIVYRIIEGKYPNYRSVIPKNNDKILIANAHEMNSALRRISVFAESLKSPVGIHATNNNLNLINISSEGNQFSDENINADFNRADYAMAFEIGNLSKCMEAIETTEFTMSFSEPTKACLITPDDLSIGLTVMIMPTLINV